MNHIYSFYAGINTKRDFVMATLERLIDGTQVFNFAFACSNDYLILF